MLYYYFVYIASSNEIRTNDTEQVEMNDGTKDISTQPSTMLLLRQLDHLSTEESIFNAVNTLEGVYRTFLIRDKMTKMSCEYAFIEFTDIRVSFINRKMKGNVLTCCISVLLLLWNMLGNY